jgi:hypothetical protein
MSAAPLLALSALTPQPIIVLATTLAGANIVVAAASTIIVVPATVVLRVIARTPNVVVSAALRAGCLGHGDQAGRERDQRKLM